MDNIEKNERLGSQDRQTFNDLQNEISGRETGRISRFLTADGRSFRTDEKRQKDKAYRDVLDMLLATDPEYFALYTRLGDELSSGEAEADSIIANLQSAIDALEQQIEVMRAGAPRLPDGRLVFRYIDGRVVDEAGALVSPEIAEGIIWRKGSPSAEQYFDALEKRQSTYDLLEQWVAYRQDYLGYLRNRYDDRAEPMTKDELKEALDDIYSKKPPHPSDLEVGAADLAGAQLTVTTAVKVPKL